MAALLARPVGGAARARARLHLADWLGCAVLGAASPAGAAMAAALAGASPGPCRALGRGDFTLDAALRFNAALGNVLEMDDVHRSSILHPGPVVVPTALALAQQRGARLGELLDAIVRGYEATIRIGRAVGLSHYRYWHNTASCGGFGAAAAAGSLYSLDRARMTDALGNAGSRSGGLWQMRHEDVMTKQWHTADAAASGAAAALLASCGVTGPAFILEGPQGLFAAMSDDADPALVTRPEVDWLIFDTSFKPWPACRHAHPAIDALLGLMAQEEIAGPAVVRVTVDTYEDALRFCDRPAPATPAQARFSIQHALAAVLRHGAPRLEHYAEAALDDPALAARRATIGLRADPAISACFPQAYGARVELLLDDGRTLRHEVRDTLGDPARPLAPAQVHDKATTLMAAAGIASAGAQRLLDIVFTLPDDADPAPFWAALP
nr:MmgE/PrpD family protein [Massilia oculi]